MKRRKILRKNEKKNPEKKNGQKIWKHPKKVYQKLQKNNHQKPVTKFNLTRNPKMGKASQNVENWKTVEKRRRIQTKYKEKSKEKQKAKMAKNFD